MSPTTITGSDAALVDLGKFDTRAIVGVLRGAPETLGITDMKELLGLPVIGVVPESRDVLTCTNLGKPVISLGEGNPAADAYMDMVDRFLGQEKELRFVTPEPVSFFKRIFG